MDEEEDEEGNTAHEKDEADREMFEKVGLPSWVATSLVVLDLRSFERVSLKIRTDGDKFWDLLYRVRSLGTSKEVAQRDIEDAKKFLHHCENPIFRSLLARNVDLWLANEIMEAGISSYQELRELPSLLEFWELVIRSNFNKFNSQVLKGRLNYAYLICSKASEKDDPGLPMPQFALEVSSEMQTTEVLKEAQVKAADLAMTLVYKIKNGCTLYQRLARQEVSTRWARTQAIGGNRSGAHVSNRYRVLVRFEEWCQERWLTAWPENGNGPRLTDLEGFCESVYFKWEDYNLDREYHSRRGAGSLENIKAGFIFAKR